MRKIEKNERYQLILYRFEAHGTTKTGKKVNYQLEFYEEDLLQAWAHAESLAKRYQLDKVEGWRITHLGFINFN